MVFFRFGPIDCAGQLIFNNFPGRLMPQTISPREGFRGRMGLNTKIFKPFLTKNHFASVRIGNTSVAPRVGRGWDIARFWSIPPPHVSLPLRMAA